MFDVTKVRNALNGLVGWQNPTDPDFAIVDAANQSSISGRKFTDNKYVKIQFLKDTQDYIDASDADFNQVLTDIQNEAISNVLDRIFDESDFIDRQLLFKNANNKMNTEVLPDGFVGYKITPSYENNYTFEITRDILEFSGTGDITLYLFNSAKLNPVKSQPVTISSPFQVQELGWKMDDTDGYYKGEYYYGYTTDSVTVLPYKRDYNNANSYSNITGLGIDSVYSEITGATMFDLDDVQSKSETWGLNPDISVYNDFTDFIIQNKRLFSYAIQLQGQIQSINVYLASLRSNRNERISDEMIRKLLVELDAGTAEGYNKKGLNGILNTEITRLKQEVLRMQRGMLDSNAITSVTRS